MLCEAKDIHTTCTNHKKVHKDQKTCIGCKVIPHMSLWESMTAKLNRIRTGTVEWSMEWTLEILHTANHAPFFSFFHTDRPQLSLFYIVEGRLLAIYGTYPLKLIKYAFDFDPKTLRRMYKFP